MKTKKDSIINIISIFLIILSVLLLFFLIIYYITHSPEFVTHIQLVGVLMTLSASMLSGFLGMWLKLTDKLTDFSGRLGNIEGKLSKIENKTK